MVAREMANEEFRMNYDLGQAEFPKPEPKLVAPGPSLMFLTAHGWEIGERVEMRMAQAQASEEGFVAARAEFLAAEERDKYWERDREAFDASALLDSGCVWSRARFPKMVRPEVDELEHTKNVWDIARKIRQREFVTEIVIDPEFEAKCDTVWATGVMGGNEDEMTVTNLREYLVSATAVRSHLQALVLLNGQSVGMTPQEQKWVRNAFKEDGARCPLVDRLRAQVRSGRKAEADERTAQETAVRVKREAEAAQTARYRNRKQDQEV